jgi:predicted transcriptional regulator
VSTTPRPARKGRCLSVELAPELLTQLRELADARGQSLAELVRRALADLVAAADSEHRPDPLADRLAAIEARLSALERGRRGRL